MAAAPRQRRDGARHRDGRKSLRSQRGGPHSSGAVYASRHPGQPTTKARMVFGIGGDRASHTWILHVRGDVDVPSPPLMADLADPAPRAVVMGETTSGLGAGASSGTSS